MIAVAREMDLTDALGGIVARYARASRPRLVPAWRLQVAWDDLHVHGELTNRYLLATDGLNVK